MDIPCHPDFRNDDLSQVVSQVKEVELDLLYNTLIKLEKPVSKTVLMKELGITNRTRFHNTCLKVLLLSELITFTIPDKPNSHLQQYVLTDKGKELMSKSNTKK